MLEREFSPPIAEQKIIEAASSLSLTFSSEYVNASRTVAVCALKNSIGVTVAEGAGKGQHCKVGALAESLEHVVLEHHSSQSLTSSAISDIRRQPLLQMDGLLANLPQSHATIDCVEMTDMQAAEQHYCPQ